MTFVSPKKGGTILAIAGKIKHLHVICTDDFFYSERGKSCFVAVAVTSVKPNCFVDDACMIRVGDHPFIRHDSFIYYKGATVMTRERVENAIASGEITIEAHISAELLERVIKGFEKSKFTQRKILNLIRENCNLSE